MSTFNKLDKISSPLLDMLYESYGWEILETAPDRKFDDWDKKLLIDGNTFHVEEKTRDVFYGDILVEIMYNY